MKFARQVTRFLREEIESESLVIAAEQLDMASDKLDTLAEVLGEAVDKLREKQNDSLACIMEIGSKSMMRLSGKLRKTSPGENNRRNRRLRAQSAGNLLGSCSSCGHPPRARVFISRRAVGNNSEILSRTGIIDRIQGGKGYRRVSWPALNATVIQTRAHLYWEIF